MSDDRPTFGSLFSGIGGIDLGLERAGWQCVWLCESDPYCRAVLAKHWPGAPCYEDVREITAVADAECDGCLEDSARQDASRASQARGSSKSREPSTRGTTGSPWAGGEVAPVDLVAGGFPCQPISLAGRRRGVEDERWLWPEFHRVIGLVRPRYVLIENVPGLLAAGADGFSGPFGGILADLASLGYDAEWTIVSAADVGAPHLRKRVFIVAYAQCDGSQGILGTRSAPRATVGASELANADAIGWRGRAGDCGPGRRGEPEDGGDGQLEPGVGRAFDGLPQELVRARHLSAWPESWEGDTPRVARGVANRVQRLRALGNAVVPQVAEVIGRLILEHAERVLPAIAGMTDAEIWAGGSFA